LWQTVPSGRAKMAEVRLIDVEKRYGPFYAVRGFNLTITDKEFVTLVGPSGCGKSTTLRMIAGLEEIGGGTIRIGGRVVNRLAPKDRDVAMVFQNYALYQHMSVYDNLAFGLRNRKVSEERIRREVASTAEMLGLTHLLGQRPHQLSGGQQQRVALGRCIVRSPQLFLFDEPLSNLDAKLRAQMRLEIKRLRERVPTTSIFVTHDQVEAMTLGDRVVVMKDGLIQQVGTPLELYNRPRNRFVASFIGAPSMNLLTAGIREANGRLYAEVPGLRVALPARRRAELDRIRTGRIIIGIRPEHVALASDTAGPDSVFEARVEVVEQLGSEIVLQASAGSSVITVARVDPELGLRAGDRVRLAILADRVHLFDADTEQTIP
jgi:multiple sugar transport system ATP-binding protein